MWPTVQMFGCKAGTCGLKTRGRTGADVTTGLVLWEGRKLNMPKIRNWEGKWMSGELWPRYVTMISGVHFEDKLGLALAEQVASLGQ